MQNGHLEKIPRILLCLFVVLAQIFAMCRTVEFVDNMYDDLDGALYVNIKVCLIISELFPVLRIIFQVPNLLV